MFTLYQTMIQAVTEKKRVGVYFTLGALIAWHFLLQSMTIYSTLLLQKVQSAKRKGAPFYVQTVADQFLQYSISLSSKV